LEIFGFEELHIRSGVHGPNHDGEKGERDFLEKNGRNFHCRGLI